MNSALKPSFGVIGGSGLTSFDDLEIVHRQMARSPWGAASGPITFGRTGNEIIAFLPRHGAGHTISPHRVNYRANIHALYSVGVRRIVAVTAVGGIRDDLVPGTLVVTDQIIDYTAGRAHTFFEGAQEGTRVEHIEFTHPYCEHTRQALLVGADSLASDVRVVDGGTYAATQGPRFESPAEIKMMRQDGGDVVGMTGMPEAALARELGICYANVSVVVNPAAGLVPRGDEISFEEIFAYLRTGIADVRTLISASAGRLGAHSCTACSGAE